MAAGRAVAEQNPWLRVAESALLAVLMAVPTLMSVAMDRGYEIPKLAALVPLAALALGALMMAGLREALGPLWREHRMACVSLAVFAGAALLATGLGESLALALYGTHGRREGLIVWLAYLAIFIVASVTLRRPGGVARCVDALLLSSIVPAAYAIEQRIGIDFFVTVMADPGRRAGTLGNPNFLAGYLALIVPLTLARAWLARSSGSGAGGTVALWLWLVMWQVLALLQTQSRGALLALIGVLGFVFCLAAARAGARRWLAVAVAVPLAFILFIALLNLLPALAQWARDIPVVNRLIFVASGEVGAATALAVRSVDARLGIWQAAADALAAAPVMVQLFGFGPDAAPTHFLPYVPPQLMTSEGYQQVSTFDRTHADMLEIAVSFGAFGWAAWVAIFFGAVMFGAARALLGLEGQAHGWMYAGMVFWTGVFGAAAAASVGLGAAAPAAFGLGLALGWMAFVTWHALGAWRHGMTMPFSRDWVMLAGLTAALLVCWIDAQVNIPVMATRVATFALAAAVLVQTARLRWPVEEPAPSVSEGDCIGWLVGIGAVCALASFWGITMSETVQGTNSGLWFFKLPSIVSLWIFAALAVKWDTRPVGKAGSAVEWQFAGWSTVPAIVFSAGQALLGAAIDSAPAVALPDRIATWTAWTTIVMLAMCIGRAAQTRGTVSCLWRTEASRLSSALSAIALMAASVVFCWRQTTGDIAFNLAEWAQRHNRSEARALSLARAVREMPHERHYLRRVIFDALERAALGLRDVRSPGDVEAIQQDLLTAEQHARAALALYPADPWLVVALANVRQHQGLRMLRRFDPDAGSAATAESYNLFARAARLYPAQPLVYLGWAQLEFDQGNLAAAYSLLDRMEGLIPRSPDPYRERILMARAVGDLIALRSTLQRAAHWLDGPGMASLNAVASAQQ